MGGFDYNVSVVSTGCASAKPPTISPRDEFKPAIYTGPITINAVILEHSANDPSIEIFLSNTMKKIETGKSMSRVKDYADLGVIAMHYNCLGIAEEAMSRAIYLSEYIDKDIVEGPESSKFFKGEPHERAMMYFYLGLCDFVSGDYENARACFRRGALQDAMAQEGIDRGDWLAMDLMQLRADYHANRQIPNKDMVRQLQSRYTAIPTSSGTAKDEETQALITQLADEQAQRAKQVIDMPVDSDIIILIALGRSPAKIALGENGAELGYLEIASKVHSVKIHLPQQSPRCIPFADDVYVQAVTRGQRQMDMVLKHREKTKTLYIQSGQVVQTVGAAVGGISGLSMQIIGALLVEHGKSKDVRADTRQLRLVPGKILLWCGKKQEMGQSFKITFEDENGNILATTDTISIPEKGKSVILLRFGG